MTRQELEAERAVHAVMLAIICSIALGAVVGAGLARAFLFAPAEVSR